MNFYIASRCQEAARAIRDELQAAGHTVTSRWLEETNYGADKTDTERMAIARIDHEDVIACDYLVFRSEPDGARVPGGKHVEMGMALALHRPVFVIGARENIFHWHPSVHVVGSVAEVLENLTP